MTLHKNRKPYIYTDINNKLIAAQKVVDEKISSQIVAEELNVSANSVRQWAKQYREHGASCFREKIVTPTTLIMIDRKELKRLQDIERKQKEQEIQIEILKKFQAFLKKK